MFIPPNLINIFSALYTTLDIGQGYAANEKFNYKDHKTLSKHQMTYENMLEELFNVIAPSKPNELINYLRNFQRLWKTLNASCFETETEQDDGDNTYWEYFFAPMLATLIHNISYSEEDPLYYLDNYVTEWNDTITNNASWVKDTIVEAINVYDISTPNFKNALQDVRCDRNLKFETINQHLRELDIDLTNENLQKEVILKVSAQYRALLFIKKIIDKGYKKQLIDIKNYLNELKKSSASKLMSQHIEVFQVLIQDHNFTIIDIGHRIIGILDQYILEYIKPINLRIVEYLEDAYYPNIKQIEEILPILERAYVHDKRPLYLALLKYYKMLYVSQHGDFQKAYDLCLKVKELSKQVHLGAYNSTNNMYEIVLYWQIHHQFIPHQFQSNITETIQTLPDEMECRIMLDEGFQKFLESLDDYEQMIFKSFRLFNEAQDLGVYADPFDKLTELIKIVLKVCNDNPEDDLPKLKDKLNKELPTAIKRSHYATGFSKRLSYADAIPMLYELYDYVSIMDTFMSDLSNADTSIIDNIYILENCQKAKELLDLFIQDLR